MVLTFFISSLYKDPHVVPFHVSLSVIRKREYDLIFHEFRFTSKEGLVEFLVSVGEMTSGKQGEVRGL